MNGEARAVDDIRRRTNGEARAVENDLWDTVGKISISSCFSKELTNGEDMSI